MRILMLISASGAIALWVIIALFTFGIFTASTELVLGIAAAAIIPALLGLLALVFDIG